MEILRGIKKVALTEPERHKDIRYVLDKRHAPAKSIGKNFNPNQAKT